MLLTEDSAVNRKIGALMLERMGCRVTMAADGHEAVRMAGSSAYDVIFMERAMPEMDGVEATLMIRARQNGGRRVPIIALTAHAGLDTREQCLSGMDDIVSKPVSPARLEQMLRKWLPQ